MIHKPTKEQKRIYNMVYRLRKKGIPVNPRDRTISIKYGTAVCRTAKALCKETSYDIQYYF